MYVKMDKFTAGLVKDLLDAHIQVLGDRYQDMVTRIEGQDGPANGYQSMVLVNTEMKMERLTDVSTQIGILTKL